MWMWQGLYWAHKIQMPGNHPEERIQHSHGESLNQETWAFFQFCLNSVYGISFCTNRYLNLMFNYRLKYESLWTSYDTASSSDIICWNSWNLKSLGCCRTIELNMFLANSALWKSSTFLSQTYVISHTLKIYGGPLALATGDLMLVHKMLLSCGRLKY